MMVNKNRFINLKSFNNEAADNIINKEIIFIVIRIIQININNKILKVENVKYIFNITLNLLSLFWLKKCNNVTFKYSDQGLAAKLAAINTIMRLSSKEILSHHHKRLIFKY